LDAREVEAVEAALKPLKVHLRLAFDVEEVVVVADMLKCQKGPPLARVRMRGR